MRNKGFIIGITILLSIICIYLLSFTFIARNIEKKAVKYATDKDGKINLEKKQKYLDSIFEEPVLNLLGIKYTYKEVKETELALGLDLQGGMHVTLEVSPVEILKVLAAGNANNPEFLAALNEASRRQANSQANFIELFYQAFAEKSSNKKLVTIFSNSLTRNMGITPSSTDDDVKKMIRSEIDRAIDRSFEILRTRIDKFGVIQPNIQKIQGTHRIQLELPGVENPQRVRNLLQGSAKLEFIEVYHLNELADKLEAIDKYLVSIKKTATTDSTSAKSKELSEIEKSLAVDAVTDTKSDTTSAKTDSLSADSTQSLKREYSELFSLLIRDSQTLLYAVKDTAKINRILEMPKVQAMLPPNITFYWERKNAKSLKENPTLELIPCRKSKNQPAPLEGNVITAASYNYDVQGSGGFEVIMRMNEAGKKKWAKITTAAASENNRRIAIILDGYCYSAPRVRQPILNGVSSISGNFTLEEAKDLSNILMAGKLPAPVRIVEEVIVGPSLGRESIIAGLQSMLVGLCLVIVFMILYYHKAGFVADVALLFNVLFTLGALASLNSVLTLPGIAGIVLTLGMAVDANVLIFERIKEELREGKALRNAIDLGFSKAFSSIFDSNITTLIVAVILLWLGSGPVKGFATTLLIGVACSFLTAVFISKIIILWMVKDKDPNSLQFTTFISRNLFKNMNFNIISKRKMSYIFSISLIAIGILTIFIQKGLNLGVDFSGGRSYIVQFEKPITATELKNILLPAFGNAGTEVKTFGTDTKMKITTSYLINDESSDADNIVAGALNNALKSIKNNKAEIISSNKVGATVADDIKNDAMISIVVALAGIFVYVLFRFKKWQFSLAGITALFHDSLMILAMFSILRLLGIPFEIDQVFVAAILTIVGFSINDTVIVFDRVREVLNQTRRDLNSFRDKNELADLINKAINHTLSRTIMTTFTVLVVVIILFLFGGESLRGFSFALLIGVIFGSYSTIFIAVPMVLDLWRNKQAKPVEAVAGTKSSTKK
ncbi:MAG: protein translocase subunit SecDF [Cytophagaceae bacterium]|nr:protein translocase subunit SecDF [Cytophagaceae bacterium]MDW8455771.1 protein translocase subunit SecDF [Cytophagaceae bacterium]